jgi:hypothetical protein
MFWNRHGHEGQGSVAQACRHHRATLLIGVLLLLFVQTLTLFFDSIYKIALTKLSVGKESLGVLFLLSPLLVFLLPKRPTGKSCGPLSPFFWPRGR